MIMRNVISGLCVMLALQPALAAPLVVVEARGIALKPGTALDDAKVLRPETGPARYADLPDRRDVEAGRPL